MTIEDDALLAEFRRVRCEYCGKRGGTVHHVHTRATGRLDIRANLIGLCQACHSSHHDGNKPKTKAILNLVAQREGLTVAAIRDAVWRLRRLDRDDQAGAAAVLSALRQRPPAGHHAARPPDGVPPGGAGAAPGRWQRGLPAGEADGPWVDF